jgi:hypothetical protein
MGVRKFPYRLGGGKNVLSYNLNLIKLEKS